MFPWGNLIYRLTRCVKTKMIGTVIVRQMYYVRHNTTVKVA